MVQYTIHVGDTVDIVLKADQRTGKLTRDTVAKLLTNSATHPQGRAPKYFLDAISCDGHSFKRLEDIPEGIILRACRSGKDGTITVCDLVCRQADGLLIGQTKVVIPPEACTPLGEVAPHGPEGAR